MKSRSRLRTVLGGSFLPSLAGLLALLGGCAAPPEAPPAPRPEEVRALIVALLPPATSDRAGWATDIYAAFASLGLTPTHENLCSAIAVAQQESSLQVDPPVPHLGSIAWAEIDRRAQAAGVPSMLVHGALQLGSRDGRSYAERIDQARTEKDLSDAFEDFIDRVPLGHKLFGDANPVRTAGPMQVAIAFAEKQAAARPYPYSTSRSIRDEVFTRRGGLYFGIAHLLDYPAHYDRQIYRFADYNAGRYASRNAAFQQALSQASGIPLDLDGDLVRHGRDAGTPGATELAARTLLQREGFSESRVRSALEQGDAEDFERTDVYRRVFELAERAERRPLPRAVLPHIALHSPKITRPLTTEWFARRVQERFERCLGAAKSR